jgi:hypothetical protein
MKNVGLMELYYPRTITFNALDLFYLEEKDDFRGRLATLVPSLNISAISYLNSKRLLDMNQVVGEGRVLMEKQET